MSRLILVIFTVVACKKTSSMELAGDAAGLLTQCDGDSAISGQACYELAKKYRQGESFSAAKAAKRMAKACIKKTWLACPQAALYARMGIGDERDVEKALSFLDSACVAGNPEACFDEANYRFSDGRYHEKKKIKSLYENAVKRFDKECTDGNADYCSNLGFMYDTGLGVPKNVALSKGYWENGCKRGSKMSCFSVHADAVQSTDVSEDIAESHWKELEALCGEGLDDACGIILTFHARELRSSWSKEKQMTVAKASCDRGYAANCMLLWVLNQDTSYLEKACLLGSPDTCLNYAGGIEDITKRTEYLNYACYGAVESACQTAQRVTKATDMRYVIESCSYGSPLACAALVADGGKLPLTKHSNQTMKDFVCQQAISDERLTSLCTNWPSI